MVRTRYVWLVAVGLIAANVVAGWLWIRGLDEAIRVADISAPNGIESVGGRPFFWLGTERTRVVVEARGPGNAELGFVPTLGPSLPGEPRRHLLVTVGTRHARVVTVEAGPYVRVVVPLGAGRNDIGLQVLDRPTVEVQPEGDRRQLLLGVGGLAVRGTPSAPTDGEPCYALFAAGWFRPERTGSDWIRWTADTGDVLVILPVADRIALGGEIVSMIRPNDITLRVNGAPGLNWRLDGQGFGEGSIPAGPIPLEAGLSVLSIRSGAQPLRLASDERPLAAAVKNLTIHRAAGAGPCTIQP